ncbi:hypothetical protein HPB51_010135 [Rhipicephalus microplus]|uniref:Uncharacterized protein n=1 Tax=Rhipicephalus microplus TaxID=6941 RepID=A0A9J6F127_RHIMP|nr:hypothetical protein HPB51_010135 [Rhipicephalus microplus]
MKQIHEEYSSSSVCLLHTRCSHIRNRMSTIARNPTTSPNKFCGIVSVVYVTITNESEAYTLQPSGSFEILMDHVVVMGRKKDVALVKAVSESAAKKFRDVAKFKVTVSVDTKNFLPEACFGGVVLSASKGRIIVTNTLDSRLELISQRMQPEIRAGLFGTNPRRKYFD